MPARPGDDQKIASLYKAFPPAEARRIIKRLEIHYTPKHGSWLDMAEIELNVMTRQCLSRRIASIEKLKCELSAWEHEYSGWFYISCPVIWKSLFRSVFVHTES